MKHYLRLQVYRRQMRMRTVRRVSRTPTSARTARVNAVLATEK